MKCFLDKAGLKLEHGTRWCPTAPMKLICKKAMPKNVCFDLKVLLLRLELDLRSDFFFGILFSWISKENQNFSRTRITLPPWSLLSLIRFCNVSEASPLGISAIASRPSRPLRPSGVVTSSRPGSPPEVESRTWPNLPGSPSDPMEFPSVWVWDVLGVRFGVRFGSLGNDPIGTPLCVGKPRNGVWQLRFSVKIRWDVVGVCLFFSEKKTGPLAQDGQRGMQTPRRWTSQQSESEQGGKGPLWWVGSRPSQSRRVLRNLPVQNLASIPDSAWPVELFF